MITQEVTVANGDVTLSATLTVPDCARGIVVFVHGSGPMDRDQNSKSAALGTFRILSDAVSQARFASLRWDKRGIGQSGGDYPTAGQSDLIADVTAMLAFARAQGLGPVITCGHSEGTALAPAAARDVPVDGHILICPYITSGRDFLIAQSRKFDRALKAQTGWRGVYGRIVAALVGWPSQKQARFLRKLVRTTSGQLKIGGQMVPVKWLRGFATMDVAAIHARNQSPTLVIAASHDAQCPPEDGAKIAAMSARATLIEVAGLSHILRRTDVADVSDYARQLTQAQDPRVAEHVTAWLNASFDAAV